MKTDRLKLRKFNINDAKNMYENWASDKRVTKSLTWSPYKNIKEAERMIKQWILDDNEENIHFAICDREDNNIGCISARLIKKEPKTYAIGYCLGGEYWSKGYMTEALKLMIGYLFDEKNAVRVEARHDYLNPASGRVMQKANMKYEGCLRKSDINNNGIADMVYYSITDDEYEINFKKPSFEELKFRKELLADEDTMLFNKNYGGVIDFSEDKWDSWYEKWIKSDERFYYYVFAKNIPVGECCIYKEEDRHICSLILKAKYRGNGYGEKTLKFLLEKCKEVGIDKLYDSIAIDNPSINLFLKLGFEKVKSNNEYTEVCKTII